MQHHFSTLMVVWGAIVACLMVGSLAWNLTHRRNARPVTRVAVRPAARVAPVAAPVSRPVVRPAARPAACIAPVAVAPVAASVAAPRRQPRARGPLGPTLREQYIAAGRIIPAAQQMPPSLLAFDPDFAPVSALDFAL